LQPDTIVTTTQPADELYQDLMYNGQLLQYRERRSRCLSAVADSLLAPFVVLSELEPGRPFSVRLMKRHDFTVESAIQRLRLLQVESLDDHAGGDGGGGDDEEGGGGGAGRTVKELSKLEHTLLLRSALDFSKTNMVCAMGGLILHLLHSSIFSQLEADPLLEPILIRAINTIPDSDVLEVDAATMASLGVFVSEAHPGGGTRSKEGLSLFGQLNRTRTQPGAQLLRHWLTYPSTNVECLLQRQQHIAYFVQPNNAVRRSTAIIAHDSLFRRALFALTSRPRVPVALDWLSEQELTGHLRQHLRHVKDITRLLLRFQDKPAKPVHYRSLVAVSETHEVYLRTPLGSIAALRLIRLLAVRFCVQSLDNMLGIHGLIQDRVDDLPLFSSLHSLFVREIASLSETITGVLKIGNDEDGGGDWGVGGGGGRARKRRGATVDGMEAPLDVRDGVSRKLDHMRDLYVRIDALLSEESAEDHRQLHRQGRLPAELIDQLVLVYMPQIGFLAKLPADPQTSPRAMERSQSLRGFEFKFRTYTDIFYKSDTTNRLDEQYGDIQGYITDARHNIIRQVQAKIMSFAEVLANIGSKMAELDWSGSAQRQQWTEWSTLVA
jgi:DNA mismatch repair ATPase MutS